jgi:tetrahydromethanopterin:alpha-L-glutamate ligase
MTTFCALVSGVGWHVEDLLRAAKRTGVSLRTALFPKISASVGMARRGPAPQDDRSAALDCSSSVRASEIDLLATDGVLVRMMPPGSLEQVVFRMDALHRIVAAGIPVLNPPRAVEAAVDKYLTLSLLERADIPVPVTWAGESATDALEVFEQLGGDVIVKPLFGSEGRGLLRISDKELAWRTFHALERLSAVLYLQRVVRHPGHDLRVFVLRGTVLGAMRRHAQPGEWRTNVSLGGRAEPCRLNPEAERLAMAAAGAIGAEMAGVDLIEDLDLGRMVVLEVNAVPGWRALSRVTGIDVAAAILVALKEMGQKGRRS